MDEHERQQEWTRRLEDLERQVQSAPDDPGLPYELAKCYFMGGRFGEAFEAFKGLAGDTRHDESMTNFYIGRIYMRQGKFDLAIKHLDQAIDQVISVSIRKDMGIQLFSCLEHEGRLGEAMRLKNLLGF